MLARSCAVTSGTADRRSARSRRDGLGEGLQGVSVEIFDRDRDALRARLETPDSLPYRDQLSLGNETLARTIYEIHDRGNARAELMVIWHRLTGHLRLTDRFERTVGRIAAAVGERARRQ